MSCHLSTSDTNSNNIRTILYYYGLELYIRLETKASDSTDCCLYDNVYLYGCSSTIISNPTSDPTHSPTKSPTKSPTSDPLKSPTVSPTCKSTKTLIFYNSFRFDWPKLIPSKLSHFTLTNS